MPSAIFGRFEPIGVGAMPVSRAPVAVRIPVRVQQQLVAFARARNGIGERAQFRRQFLEQITVLRSSAAPRQ